MVKRKSKADRLAALRDKLKNTDTGGSSGFMRLNQGRNVVRVLPEVGDMEFFFQCVGTHEFPDKSRVYCPAFTSEGELDCPICEMVQELYKSVDKASKALADQLRVRRKFWMNVINRDDEDRGPLILTAGVTIFNPISNIVSDPDYGDVTDIEDGVDIIIKREGEGLNTKYDVIARRHDSPLSSDSDQAQRWLDVARDLSYVEVSDDPHEDMELSDGHAVYVLPYDRIAQEFDLDCVHTYNDESVDDDSEEDVEDEETPARREISRRRARRR